MASENAATDQAELGIRRKTMSNYTVKISKIVSPGNVDTIDAVVEAPSLRAAKVIATGMAKEVISKHDATYGATATIKAESGEVYGREYCLGEWEPKWYRAYSK